MHTLPTGKLQLLFEQLRYDGIQRRTWLAALHGLKLHLDKRSMDVFRNTNGTIRSLLGFAHAHTDTLCIQ